MKKVLQCQTCGEKFQADILIHGDKQEAVKLGKPIRSIVCPNCHSKNIVEI